jgi:hypothetical protein
MWNEQIAVSFSGSFKECHSGLTTGPDPIDNNKGTFTITDNADPTADTITYNYGDSGGPYTYEVFTVPASSHYCFRRVSDSKTYDVHITACPPTGGLNNCP